MLRAYDANKREISRGTLENPLLSSHNGKNGNSYVFLIYVKNTDPAVYYENVRVYPIDKTNPSTGKDINGQYADGFSVKLSYGTTPPLPFEWDNIVPGEAATIPVSIGSISEADITTFYPIWVRINVPGNTNVQEKTNIALRISASKGVVV